MNVLRQWGLPSRLALVGLLLAGMAAGREVADVVRLDALPEARPDPGTVGGVAGDDVTPRAGTPRAVVFTAVAKDPFRSDRKRPSTRYRLPGDELGPTAARPVPTPSMDLTLVGTALRGNARLAVVQEPRRAPRVLHVGDSIAGFELVSVERRLATLRGIDTTLVLVLPGSPGEERDTTRTRTAASRRPR